MPRVTGHRRRLLRTNAVSGVITVVRIYREDLEISSLVECKIALLVVDDVVADASSRFRYDEWKNEP
jgi:hypothetical protein